jgi:transcription elongation factor GreA
MEEIVQTITDQKARGRGKKAAASTSQKSDAVELYEIRERIDDVLNRLGAQLIGRISDSAEAAQTDATDPGTAELQLHVARLGQLAAGLAVVDSECLPLEGAGYGSMVQLRNLDTGECDEYTLMVGSLVDIGANQVSLASPIGQALLGKRAGEKITITTPYKQARMFVMKVVTLMELLSNYETSAASTQR